MHSSNRMRPFSHATSPSHAFSWLVVCLLFGGGEAAKEGEKRENIQQRGQRPTSSDISHTLPAHRGRLVLNCGGVEITDRDTFSGTDHSETALPTRKVTPCPCTRSFYHHVRSRDIFSEQASKYESGSEPFVKELY